MRVLAASWQRCHVHWMRNALAYVPQTQQSRANVIGIFPNEAAIVRLIGAVLLEQNDE